MQIDKIKDSENKTYIRLDLKFKISFFVILFFIINSCGLKNSKKNIKYELGKNGKGNWIQEEKESYNDSIKKKFWYNEAFKNLETKYGKKRTEILRKVINQFASEKLSIKSMTDIDLINNLDSLYGKWIESLDDKNEIILKEDFKKNFSQVNSENKFYEIDKNIYKSRLLAAKSEIYFKFISNNHEFLNINHLYNSNRIRFTNQR